MKVYTIFAVAVFLVLSWCATSSSQQGDYSVQHSENNQIETDKQSPSQNTNQGDEKVNTNRIEQEYTFSVDHNVGGEIKEITLRPHQETVQFFDNASETTLWTYGSGQEPVIVRAQQGDTLKVTLDNALSQETSIHRHGIRVPNKEDGVPWVTQEPVAPWASYEYTIPLQDEGTFFFHPHINTVEQMARWLYWVLIVEPKEPIYTYDEEIVVSLKDYRLNRDGTLNENFDGMMDYTHGGRLWNVLTVNNLVQPTFAVNEGSTVLVRLVNPSNARIYNIDLRDWNAQVVGVDWWPVATPYVPSIVQLGPWERINLLVEIGQQPLQLIDRYFGDPTLLATLETNVNIAWENVHSLNPENFPEIPDWSALAGGQPDDIIDLWWIGVMGGDRRMGMGIWQRWWTINDGVWPDSNEQLTWKTGELRVVRLKNNSRRDHPMHLHGDFFQVVGINGQKVPRKGWKDTINVPPQWYVDLAIIPTNPGRWMFHCHIIEHAEFGMKTTIKVE